jgi:hypothetical protein
VLVVTNTANPPAAFSAAGLPSTTAHTWVHFTIWSTKLEHVFDLNPRVSISQTVSEQVVR